MERAVLDQLADYFRTRLGGYLTTLKEDESFVIFGLVNLIGIKTYIIICLV